MRKAKLSLIASISIGLLAISTAGVSTYAWFQANANVTISASSSSTTITVSKPDDYTFYYYNKNGSSDYNTPDGTFSSDFTAVPSSSLSEGVTLWTGIYPGQSMVFAMEVEGLNTSSDDVTLAISKIVSNDTTKQSNATYKRYVRGGSSVQINIGWAIDIYALSSSSNTAYSTLSYESSTKSFLNTSNTNNATTPGSGIIRDHFAYYYDAGDSTKYSALTTGSYGSDEITTSINLINAERATATTMYYFFRVYFSNTGSTLYKEVDGSGGDLIEPANESTTNRYFDSDSSTGTSNCYAGLQFSLVSMSLTW